VGVVVGVLLVDFDPDDVGVWAPEAAALVADVVGTFGSGLMPAALAGATTGCLPGSPVTPGELFLVAWAVGGSTL
jgi:hypothetical protein